MILTNQEQFLYDNIEWNESKIPNGVNNGDMTRKLFYLMFYNDRIPNNRLQFFVNKDYNIGTKKSRYKMFYYNGCKTDDEVFSHNHFLKYLKFFIDGSSFNNKDKQDFKEIYSEDDNKLRKFIRDYKKSQTGYPNNTGVATEFLKLAIELECNNPRRYYDIAMSIKK